MSNIDIKKLNIKVYSSLNTLKNILQKNFFKLEKSYFTLRIYFVENQTNICDINNIKSLSNYAYIEEVNGKEAKIVFKDKNNLKGIISRISTTKQLLQKFGYKEIFYINKDISIYKNQNISFDIVVNEVRNQGIFLNFTPNDNNTSIQDILDYLKKLNIYFEEKDIFRENEDIEINKLKNRNI